MADLFVTGPIAEGHRQVGSGISCLSGAGRVWGSYDNLDQVLLRRPSLSCVADQLHGLAVLSLSAEPSDGRGDARVPGHRGQP